MRKKVQSTISATQARMRFGEIVKRAYVSQEQVVVEKDGIPVVVILSFPYYEQLLREIKLARFEHVSRVAGLEAEREGLTEEKLEREMDEIRERLYQETYVG